jgi:hypothetical protein
MSYRDADIAIISIAQQARPNVTGQIDERRAHCTIFSTVVVRTGSSASDMDLLQPSAFVLRTCSVPQSRTPLRHT